MSGLPIGPLARKVRDLAPRKLTSPSDLDALKDVASRIEDVLDERNLAVHGVRELMPNEIVRAKVTRRTYKGTLQRLPMMRLRSLNVEVEGIIAVIEPLLLAHGVIEGITEASRRSPDRI